MRQGRYPLPSPASRLAAAAALAALLLGSTGAGAQGAQQQTELEQFTDWGRVSRTVIQPVTAGTWDGTWLYVNRDERVVMWIKTEDGEPRVKVRFDSTATTEVFETDWTTRAEYTWQNGEGRFAMEFSRRDAVSMEGRWDWRLVRPRHERLELGAFRLYRAGDGRFMVLDFTDYKKSMSAGTDKRMFEARPSWTFKKASKRLVLWEELPF